MARGLEEETEMQEPTDKERLTIWSALDVAAQAYDKDAATFGELEEAARANGGETGERQAEMMGRLRQTFEEQAADARKLMERYE
jgi:hypothetical protein